METGELLGMAKQPADAAYGRAADFKSGIQQVSLRTLVMGVNRSRVTASLRQPNVYQQVRELNNPSSSCYCAAHLARNRPGASAHPPKPVAARCPPRAPQEAECVAESPFAFGHAMLPLQTERWTADGHIGRLHSPSRPRVAQANARLDPRRARLARQVCSVHCA